MKCWICGQEADSREHRIKAKDIRETFGRVNSDKPLYLHTENRKAQKIQGLKSNKIKWGASLCRYCNNERTQPFDYAWDQLSSHLRKRSPPVEKGEKVRLDRAFPGSVHRSMIDVHLYFVKWFGCVIVEESIPLNPTQLATAIIKRESHPYLFLGFWECIGVLGKKQMGSTPIGTRKKNGRVVYANGFYDLGQFAVNVIYAEPGQASRGQIDAWHPDTGTKILRIKGR